MILCDSRKMAIKVSAILIVCLHGLVHAQIRETVDIKVSHQIENFKVHIGKCEKKFICGMRTTPTSYTVDCVDPVLVCNGNFDCTNGKDEHGCPASMCKGMVICSDMKTCAIPCDGKATCEGGEDEDRCPPKCRKDQLLCSDYVTCGNPCDTIQDCPGGEDEMNCAPKCRKDQLLCSDYVTCGNPCDTIQDCPGGEDEMNCAPVCPDGQVLCADGSECVNPCDGTPECPCGGDERDCPFQCDCTYGQYVCATSNKCLDRAHVCQGMGAMEGPEHSCGRGKSRGDNEDDNPFGFRSFQCDCTYGQYVCATSNKCLDRDYVCQGLGDMEDPGYSCGRGKSRGDDEDDSPFGFRCN